MANMNNSGSDRDDMGGLEVYFDAARADSVHLSESLKLSILDDAISVQRSFEPQLELSVSRNQASWWTDLLSLFGGWRPVGALTLSAFVGVGAGFAAADSIASLVSATPTTVTADLAPDIFSGLEEILLEG